MTSVATTPTAAPIDREQTCPLLLRVFVNEVSFSIRLFCTIIGYHISGIVRVLGSVPYSDTTYLGLNSTNLSQCENYNPCHHTLIQWRILEIQSSLARISSPVTPYHSLLLLPSVTPCYPLHPLLIVTPLLPLLPLLP